MFYTKDGELFTGVRSDLNKAKKGTAEYNAWLEKYRAKKGRKQEIEDNKGKDTIKARKAIAGISTLTADSVAEAIKDLKENGVKSTKINGVKVSIHTEPNSIHFQVHSDYSNASHTAAHYEIPKDKLTKKDLGDIAVTINKIINQYADYYLPKAGSQEHD